MSLCYYLQSKTEFYVGADSAITINSQRSIYDLPKLNVFGKSLLFLAGTVNASMYVNSKLSSLEEVTLSAVQETLREQYKKELKHYTEGAEVAGVKTEVIQAVFCTFLPDGTTISYNMRSSEDFKAEEFIGFDGGFHMRAVGWKSDEAFAVGSAIYREGRVTRVENLIKEVFKKCAGDYIGGCLTIYSASKNTGVRLMSKQRIPETLRIPVTSESLLRSADAHCVASTVVGTTINGSFVNGTEITGSTITGSLVRTAASGQRIELSSSGNLLQAVNGAGSTFSILPSIVGTPGLQWENGTNQAQVMLQPGVMSINTQGYPTHITVAAGRNVNLFPGAGHSIVIPHFDSLYSAGNMQSLGDRLSSIESQLSSLSMGYASLASRVSALETAP